VTVSQTQRTSVCAPATPAHARTRARSTLDTVSPHTFARGADADVPRDVLREAFAMSPHRVQMRSEIANVLAALHPGALCGSVKRTRTDVCKLAQDLAGEGGSKWRRIVERSLRAHADTFVSVSDNAMCCVVS
jgi:hypothetical protein